MRDKEVVLIILTAALAGCGLFTVTRAEPKAPTEESTADDRGSETSRGPERRVVSLDEVRGWARRASEMDCPVTQADTDAMRDFRGGGDQPVELIHSIGCACAVDYTCEGVKRLSADRCHLYGPLKKARDFKYFQDNEGDRAIIAWAERLHAKEKVAADELTRADALLAVKPTVTDDEQKQTPIYEALAQAVRKMDEAIRVKTWFLVDDYHENFKVNLATLEKNILCGEQSRPGRALLIEADKRMDAARDKIVQWNKVEAAVKKDGQYQSLAAKARKLEAKARRIALDHHIPDGDYDKFCSDHPSDRSTMCEIEDQLGELSSKMDEIFSRYERKFGYSSDEPATAPTP